MKNKLIKIILLMSVVCSCKKELPESNGSKYPACFTDDHIKSCRYCGDNNEATVPPCPNPCEYWDVDNNGVVDNADVEKMKTNKCP